MTQDEGRAHTRPVDGPYLRAAFICEKILEERDGVRSFIRRIDRIQVQASGPDAPDTMPSGRVGFTTYVSFVQGEARGNVNVEIKLEPPSVVDTKTLWAGTLDFAGGIGQGHDIVLNTRLDVTQSGLYWLDVYVEGERLTRTPLRISYVRSSTQPVPRHG